MNYNFSLDNNFNNLEYNNLETQFTYNKFLTKFNFIEESGKIGNSNSIENTTEIMMDRFLISFLLNNITLSAVTKTP